MLDSKLQIQEQNSLSFQEFFKIIYNKCAMERDSDPTLIRSLKGHRQSIITHDLHPTCRYLASTGMDSNILLWDLSKQGQPHKLIGHKSQVHDLKFSPNGNVLVSASNDQSLKFWEVDFDQKSKQVTLIKAHNARIRGLSFSCDGLLLASCGDDKLIKVWSIVDRRLQYTLKKHQNWVRYCQFSPNAINLVSCDDKVIYIWDINTKKQVQSYKSHKGVIHQVKFHNLGNCIASCSHDKKIKLYDLRSQNVIQIYEGHSGPVKSIDFHPSCPYLISSSEDNTIKIWNSQQGQLQYTLETHSNNTKFSKYGDYFTSGGSDKIINIWKTGFFDSFKQKITENEETINANRKKIVENVFKFVTKQATMQQTQPTKLLISKNQQKRQTKQVYYNHTEQQFELQNKQPEQPKLQQILPQRILKKLSRINNQIQFITKTTQILQARVINNGEQLKRIISLVDL